MVNAVELPVSTGVSAMQMAQTMFGSSIQIVNATYTGDPLSAGIYTGGDTVAPGVTPSDTGVILSTGRVGDLTGFISAANQSSSPRTTASGVTGDASMKTVCGSKTSDASTFKAEFMPLGSILTMQITFSSAEFLECVGADLNDAVGVWVNGAKATLTVGEILIDNINTESGSGQYIYNVKDQASAGMDGYTVTLALKAMVTPSVVNTIKIAIAEPGVSKRGSNLRIATDSIQTEVAAVDDSLIVGLPSQTEFYLTGDDIITDCGTLTVTKINRIPVVGGSHVTMPSGLELVVNGNGTITVMTDAPGSASFTNQVANNAGIPEVGGVTGEVVRCFFESARIETDRGPVRVEDIAVGDMVLTLDDGYQPVRWHGRREVVSRGDLAPVRIPAGTFGEHGALTVSPQHRLYFSGWRAELYCGKDEVLVRAIQLVKAGHLKQDCSGRLVTYHHLLFDRHQIIRVDGLWSESYYPGPTTLPDHDRHTQAELLTLFPEFKRDQLQGQGAPARPKSTAQAAALLLA